MKILFVINNEEIVFDASMDRLMALQKKLQKRISAQLLAGTRVESVISYSLLNLDAPRAILVGNGVARDPKQIAVTDTITNVLNRTF